jgi:transcriptional regulator with XRE-family HTH domain
MLSFVMNIGERLETWRKLWGFSQRELARRAELTNGTLSQIEQGKTSPSLATVQKLATAFHLDVQTFLFGEQTAPLIVINEGAAPLVPLLYGSAGVYDFDAISAPFKRVHIASGGIFDTQDLQSLIKASRESSVSAWWQVYIVFGDASITVAGLHVTLLVGDACSVNRQLPFVIQAFGDQPVEFILLSH